MSDKITYILGAGASANAVPVVEKFNESVIDFIKEAGSYSIDDVKYDGFNADIPITKKKLQETFIQESNQIIEKVNLGHTSIDNYARMLYLTERHVELRKLKSLLQLYLLWIQFQKPYDKRYDLFLATVLSLNDNELILPDNIQVMTWNYDFQFEIASENYFKTDDIRYLHQYLNSTVSSSNILKIKNGDGFSIISLNGSSLAWYEGERPKNLSIQLSKAKSNINNKELFEDILSYYYWFALVPLGNRAGINYAWESNVHTKEIRQIAFNKAAKTDILVIIGYSFPTFNRSLDRQLISDMQKLKKVYIQTMEKSMSEVTNRFKSLAGKDIDIIPVEMTSGKEEFYIPFEFIGQ